MDLQLSGHRVLITGGGSGIGLATAERFLEEGADVVIWDLCANLDQVIDRLAASTDQLVIGQHVDITDEQTIHEALQHLPPQWTAIDHLIHAAAIGSGCYGFPFTNLSPADWDRVLQVNIRGTVNVAHATTPFLKRGQDASLVIISSVAGQIGSPTDPPYSASKAANINFAQCMARDLARDSVRVNTVCPGMVETPLNRNVWQAWVSQQPPDEQLSYSEWATDKINAVVPLGRWQTTDDLADMIVFLSSPRTRNVTGQTINVDGGFVMHW